MISDEIYDIRREMLSLREKLYNIAKKIEKLEGKI